MPTTPASEDLFAKFTVAGAVMIVCLEAMYYGFSGVPSFWMPSVDAFHKTAIGRDFLNVWMGGRSALADGPLGWFDLHTYNVYLREFLNQPDLHDYIWSYPPHVLLFIWPFGLMPYFAAYVAWCVIGLGLFLWAASAGGVERRHLLFCAVAPGVAMTIFFGQNGCITAALLIGGLINLDKRPLFAGVLFGILTIKPQLGLLLPVVLLLTWRWRVILSAAVTTAVLVGLTALIYGPEIWVGYLQKVVPQQHWLQENGAGLLFYVIPSAFYAIRLWGLSPELAWKVQTVVSLIGVAAVVWTFARRRDPVLSMCLLVVAIFIVSPYSLNYDMVIFAWVAVLLRQRPDNEPIDDILGLALWSLPVTMMLFGAILIPLGMIVLPAMAGRLVYRMWREQTVRAKVPAPKAEYAPPLPQSSPAR
jgi:hypothetical protein